MKFLSIRKNTNEVYKHKIKDILCSIAQEPGQMRLLGTRKSVNDVAPDTNKGK